MVTRKLKELRRRGRPRRRWCEDMEGDLREIRVVGWRSKVLDREESVSYTHLDVYKRQTLHCVKF